MVAPSDDFEQNPYWVVNRIRSRSLRNRVMASFTADWKVNGWLRLKARGNVDYVNDKVRQKFYASTAPALAGANGRYIESSYSETLFNGELLAMFDKRLSPDWEFSATAGAGLNDRTVNSLRIDSKTGVALFPQRVQRRQYRHERFGLCRRTDRCAAPDAVAFRHGVVQICREPQFRGYGTQRLGIDARLHLPRRQRVLLLFGRRIVGDRQDVRVAPVVSFAKVRLTWSRVGNDIPMFITNPKSHVTAGGGINAADAAPGTDLKPEMTNALEAGLEWRFLDDRLGVNLTYYKTNTHNQFFKLPALSGEAYAYRYENAGNIENQGVEVSLNAYPVYGGALTWQSTVNFAHNRNRVIKLHDELREYVYGPSSFSSSYAMKLVEGGSIGDIYGGRQSATQRGRSSTSRRRFLPGCPAPWATAIR